MACDNLARHIIDVLNRSLSEPTRRQLWVAYTQPATLHEGEDMAALRAAARGLLLAVQMHGVRKPTHLDLESQGGKMALRFGRLALALEGLEQGQAPPASRPCDGQVEEVA